MSWTAPYPSYRATASVPPYCRSRAEVILWRMVLLPQLPNLRLQQFVILEPLLFQHLILLSHLLNLRFQQFILKLLSLHFSSLSLHAGRGINSLLKSCRWIIIITRKNFSRRKEKLSHSRSAYHCKSSYNGDKSKFSLKHFNAPLSILRPINETLISQYHNDIVNKFQFMIIIYLQTCRH